MKTITEISKAILDGNFTRDELQLIFDAARQADKLRSQKESTLNLTKLKVGGFGTLTGLTPKKLNGKRVEIKEITRGKVRVQEVGNDGWDGGYRVPASCITPD